MGQYSVRLGMAAIVAASLAGCGVTAPALRPAASPVRALSAPMAAESVPTVDELNRLAAASPDRVVPNAAPEPGFQAESKLHFGPTPPAGDLDNFGKVDDTLWRGARPTDNGLQKLVTMGVKTIVNLENDKASVDHEQAWAAAHGLKFVNIPLSVITPPSMAHINQFLTLTQDQTSRPLYFHCMQGRDRTGTACFTYRISHDHWTYDRAYQEMLDYHFHTYLLGLRAFLVWYAHEANEQKAATAP